jgi:hypothetical protein
MSDAGDTGRCEFDDGQKKLHVNTFTALVIDSNDPTPKSNSFQLLA